MSRREHESLQRDTAVTAWDGSGRSLIPPLVLLRFSHVPLTLLATNYLSK